jgi:hypothetical protein
VVEEIRYSISALSLSCHPTKRSANEPSNDRFSLFSSCSTSFSSLDDPVAAHCPLLSCFFHFLSSFYFPVSPRRHCRLPFHSLAVSLKQYLSALCRPISHFLDVSPSGSFTCTRQFGSNFFLALFPFTVSLAGSQAELKFPINLHQIICTLQFNSLSFSMTWMLIIPVLLPSPLPPSSVIQPSSASSRSV